MPKMKFMNTHVNNMTMKDVIVKIDKLITNNQISYVVTPNVDHIVRIEHDDEFKEIYENADLVLVDGMPLIWISQLYGNKIIEKVSGSDLFPLLCEMAAKRNYSMFFLGAEEGVAKKAADSLSKKYSGLKIVGTYSPPFGFEKDIEEINHIIALIQEASPHILVVGLGSPKQEKFIYQYRKQINVPIALGLGASLDFEAGNIKRAPKWMQNVGLEWFYRLYKEPKRMFKRYLVDDIKIIKLFWKYRKNNKR